MANSIINIIRQCCDLELQFYGQGLTMKTSLKPCLKGRANPVHDVNLEVFCNKLVRD